ncbi:MAG: hypothetical protein GF330_01460, partial [Candidatus Eisenbacteria bacterium]|nr:hypothetical protein [Candidatus Eisenbacteria bacterium]
PLRGLAEVTGTVLRTGGTASVPGDELDARLEQMGGYIESSISTSEGTVSASFLAADAEEGLALLADLLRNPAFPEEKLDLAKVEKRTQISSRNDEPLQIAFREFRKLMYGADSPYGWHPEYETIEAIGRDDLVRFHRTYFHPDRMILTVAGDFETEAMLAEIEHVFGSWPPIGQPLPPDPLVAESGPQGVYYAEKEGVTQSTVLFGLLGTLASDPDYAELKLLNQVLGEGFSGRLMNEIRTKRGLAYATGSGPGVGWHHRGVWMAYVLAQSESTLVATDLLRHEIERITREPVTDEELERAKDVELNQLVFDLSSKGAVLNRKAFYEFHGYPSDFLERYQARVASITAEDLLAAAQRHIHPDDLATLVVGLEEDFSGDIASLGKVTEIDITIPDPPSKFEAPPMTDANLAAGREILAAAAVAHGGPVLARARSVRTQGSGKVSMMGQEMALTYESVRIFPMRSWSQMTIGGMFKITTVLDGESGWRQTPQGIADLAGPELADARADEMRSTFHILRNWQEMKWQALESRDFDGVTCDVVYAPEAGVEEWRLYFDADTHLLRGMEYRGRGRTGPVHAVERFGDYRDVDGARLAHQTRVTHDGEQIVELQLESAQLDVEADEGIFQRPGP